MTAASTRHSHSLIALLLAALAATAANTSFGSATDDCAKPQELFALERIEGSVPALERWDLHDEERLQVSMGSVPVAIDGVDPLVFRVRRNRDPKRLYRSPLTISSELGFVDRSSVDWLPSKSELLPVHVAYGHSDYANQLSLYLFVYEGAPVENMFREQMLNAPRHVLTGRPPLTLFMISGSVPPEHLEAVEARAKQWLVSAWEYYEEVCAR